SRLRARGRGLLEYRGDASAGIVLREDDELDYVRAVGNLSYLKAAASLNGSQATTGLGHTRWASHGGVSEENAHPLTGCNDGELALVLNGIVENYRELKESLAGEGHEFNSETDAEVVAHLIERNYSGDLVEAVEKAYAELQGHLAFVALHPAQPDLLVGARFQCPLVVGVGEGEMFLGSNAAAFLRETRSVMFPDDGDIVAITPEGARFSRADGDPVHHETLVLDWAAESAEKAGYETFMLKEIYEQPDAVRETIGDRVRHGRLVVEGLGIPDADLRALRRIVILPCGTSYHAGVVGRYAIEEWARIPAEPDIASEW